MGEFFCNNLVIRALIIYFCSVLIDLINDYKNVYSRNNNVCLGVCMMVFMRIVSIKKRLGNAFLRVLILLNIIFSMKSDIRDVWGMG